jgi:hypothetical protein
MANTKDIGSLYWHPTSYKIKPKELWEKAESQETEYPFRRGAAIIVRLPFSKKALVMGIWKETGFSESEALTSAVNGRGLTKNEVDWDLIRQGAEDDF